MPEVCAPANALGRNVFEHLNGVALGNLRPHESRSPLKRHAPATLGAPALEQDPSRRSSLVWGVFTSWSVAGGARREVDSCYPSQ
jgi:hypothetical protein